MSEAAFEKIAEGLREALALVRRGEADIEIRLRARPDGTPGVVRVLRPLGCPSEPLSLEPDQGEGDIRQRRIGR